MPNLICNYNAQMGGVDHQDWLVSKVHRFYSWREMVLIPGYSLP